MTRSGFFARLPRFSECCCCIELRIGVIILCVLGILSSLNDISNEFDEDNERSNPLNNRALTKFFGISQSGYREKVDTIDDIKFGVDWIVDIILTVLLIIGTIKRHVVMLKIYVILVMIVTGRNAAIAIYVCSFALPFGIIMLADLAINLYLIFCVNSYLQEILDEQEQQTAVQNTVVFKPEENTISNV